MSKKKTAARPRKPNEKTGKKTKGEFTFMGTDHKRYFLTLREKLFCEDYMESRGNRVQAVVNAGYDVFYKKSGVSTGAVNYNLASVMASEILRKPKISQYITFLMDRYGWNDENVDKQLLKIIQQDDELHAKRGAIDIFNKLKGRYAPQKVEVTDLRKMKDEELLAAAGLSQPDEGNTTK